VLVLAHRCCQLLLVFKTPHSHKSQATGLPKKALKNDLSLNVEFLSSGVPVFYVPVIRKKLA
jgi:hypothetical protein